MNDRQKKCSVSFVVSFRLLDQSIHECPAAPFLALSATDSKTDSKKQPMSRKDEDINTILLNHDHTLEFRTSSEWRNLLLLAGVSFFVTRVERTAPKLDPEEVKKAETKKIAAKIEVQNDEAAKTPASIYDLNEVQLSQLSHVVSKRVALAHLDTSSFLKPAVNTVEHAIETVLPLFAETNDNFNPAKERRLEAEIKQQSNLMTAKLSLTLYLNTSIVKEVEK